MVMVEIYITRQGLTLVHFSAQPEPFLSLKPFNHPAYATKNAHVRKKSGRVLQGLPLVDFSAQREPFLSLKPVQTPSLSHEKCSRRAEKCTSVGPWRRAEAPIPVVSLVGYTNAGKSSILNQLTAAGVLAEDQLFATLVGRCRLTPG